MPPPASSVRPSSTRVWPSHTSSTPLAREDSPLRPGLGNLHASGSQYRSDDISREIQLLRDELKAVHEFHVTEANKLSEKLSGFMAEVRSWMKSFTADRTNVAVMPSSGRVGILKNHHLSFLLLVLIGDFVLNSGQ